MLAWTDQDPPLEKILETVTLYWMTDTISRSFWHNRAMAGAGDEPKMARISVVSFPHPSSEFQETVTLTI